MRGAAVAQGDGCPPGTTWPLQAHRASPGGHGRCPSLAPSVVAMDETRRRPACVAWPEPEGGRSSLAEDLAQEDCHRYGEE